MQEQTLYPYRINKHFVYVNATKQIIINKEYDMAYPFQGKYALVVLKGKRGIINKDGKWILKPKHERLSIKKIGPIHIFVSCDYYDTNYEIHRWRILPNYSILSQKGPLLATAISYTKWKIYDETGKRILKRTSNQSYDDYNNRGNYYGENDHGYSFYFKDKKLFIHDENKNRVYIYQPNKGNGLHLYRRLTNVSIVVDKGYLSFIKGGNEATLTDFNRKSTNYKPFTFIRNLNTEPSMGENLSISNQSLWKQDEHYLCSLSFGDPLIPVPASVVDKATHLLYPLDRSGKLFWLNMLSENTGVINRSGNWVLNNDDIAFRAIYGDLAVLYKQKKENCYYIFKEGKSYPFPIGTQPDSRINGLIWKLELSSEKGEREYIIYDIQQQKVLIEPTKSITHLGDEFYQKLIVDEINGNSYIITNYNKENISKGIYDSIVKFNESDEIVYVRDKQSSASFYVVIKTGEELRVSPN